MLSSAPTARYRSGSATHGIRVQSFYQLRGFVTIRTGLEEAQRNGDYSKANVYAGQAVGLVRDLPSAGELVGRLSAEAEACLSERCAALLGTS
jgi:NAD(P)H-dependent flavin oxidoreductase YrpB (nitropropane dioxygenase family)